MDTKQKLVNDYLSTFITTSRSSRMESVLGLRQRYMTVLLEDIFQPHNASAVLRSCDAFGVQDVHIIENRNSYRINPSVELGTAQWISLRRHNGQGNNTPSALRDLKQAGYRLLAAVPQAHISLEEIDLAMGPIVLMFGNELDGLSREALQMADETFSIPMYGFVDSFNISVSVAITLYSLNNILRNSNIDWKLSCQDREDIRGHWLRSTIKNADMLEAAYYGRHSFHASEHASLKKQELKEDRHRKRENELNDAEI